MKTQSNWQFLAIMGVLAVFMLGAGLALAEHDDGYRDRHHGMMHEDNERDDDDREKGRGWHHGEGYSGHHGDGHHMWSGSWSGKSWWSSLSDEQRQAIEKSKLAMKKQGMESYAELKVAKAELAQLNMADKPDQAQIDKKIDQITQLMNTLMKQRNEYRQQVRSVLNDEQRLAYDAGKSCSKGGGWHH